MKNTVQYCGRFTLLQVTKFRKYSSLDIPGTAQTQKITIKEPDLGSQGIVLLKPLLTNCKKPIHIEIFLN